MDRELLEFRQIGVREACFVFGFILVLLLAVILDTDAAFATFQSRRITTLRPREILVVLDGIN